MHNLLLQKQARTCCSTSLHSPLAAEQSSTREEKRVQCSHTHWRQLEFCRDKPSKTGYDLLFSDVNTLLRIMYSDRDPRHLPRTWGAYGRLKLMASWVQAKA